MNYRAFLISLTSLLGISVYFASNGMGLKDSESVRIQTRNVDFSESVVVPKLGLPTSRKKTLAEEFEELGIEYPVQHITEGYLFLSVIQDSRICAEKMRAAVQQRGQPIYIMDEFQSNLRHISEWAFGKNNFVRFATTTIDGKTDGKCRTQITNSSTASDNTLAVLTVVLSQKQKKLTEHWVFLPEPLEDEMAD